jgi:flavin reductase (DIM6/NTAB) family NADH-FMN oxidoreductase RutF
MTIASDDLRRVMRQWATGVTLVTTSVDQVMHGMTVSSFCSISLSPPLILVSLSNDARTRELISQSQRFAVSILAQGQQDLADRFAGRVPDAANRFQDVDHRITGLGNPIPEGCIAFLDCLVTETYEAGNHSILIGQVQDLEIVQSASPLVYYDRDYRELKSKR